MPLLFRLPCRSNPPAVPSSLLPQDAHLGSLDPLRIAVIGQTVSVAAKGIGMSVHTVRVPQVTAAIAITIVARHRGLLCRRAPLCAGQIVLTSR